MAVLEKNKILPWQKKPTQLSAPKSNPTTIRNDHPLPPQETEEPSEEPLTTRPPDQPSSTTKEVPVELLESSDLTTSQTRPPSGITEKETELLVTAAANEATSSPDTPSTQGDKVVVVKPPTAAAYKM